MEGGPRFQTGQPPASVPPATSSAIYQQSIGRYPPATNQQAQQMPNPPMSNPIQRPDLFPLPQQQQQHQQQRIPIDFSRPPAPSSGSSSSSQSSVPASADFFSAYPYSNGVSNANPYANPTPRATDYPPTSSDQFINPAPQSQRRPFLLANLAPQMSQQPMHSMPAASTNPMNPYHQPQSLPQQQMQVPAPRDATSPHSYSSQNFIHPHMQQQQHPSSAPAAAPPTLYSGHATLPVNPQLQMHQPQMNIPPTAGYAGQATTSRPQMFVPPPPRNLTDSFRNMPTARSPLDPPLTETANRNIFSEQPQSSFAQQQSVEQDPVAASTNTQPDHRDASDARSDVTGSDDSTQAAKASLSRHVSSVISHFTATEEGYKRLLNEIDDFLHVVSPAGNMVYCSPSVKRFLGYTQSELAGHHVTEIVHREDRQPLLRSLDRCVSDKQEYLIHLRYQKKAGDLVLLEIRGKALIDTDRNEVKSVILAGREYRSKASLSIDSLLEYRIENIRLRRQLEAELRGKGIDPTTHPLLKVGPIIPQVIDFNDPEAFGPSAQLTDSLASTDGASGELPIVSNLDMDNGKQSASGELKTSRRKRKAPKNEELFCRQCGTTQSPEWRKGPAGPKTLCNACGLAYSKKQRKLSKGGNADKPPQAPPNGSQASAAEEVPAAAPGRM